MIESGPIAPVSRPAQFHYIQATILENSQIIRYGIEWWQTSCLTRALSAKDASLRPLITGKKDTTSELFHHKIDLTRCPWLNNSQIEKPIFATLETGPQTDLKFVKQLRLLIIIRAASIDF